jgi:NADPH:quinone reductase-like Zn-dependent oxidoreductase
MDPKEGWQEAGLEGQADMKALQIARSGGPEALKVVELPSPALMPDGVRIQVAAAGVNFADLMMRMGLYPEAPPLPFVPGYEVAGVVTETGDQVRKLKPGDRVMAGCRFGGYASEVVLPEFQVRKTPSHLSDAEAASIPVNFMTAWVALEEMGRVRSGDRVLVPSAAGGVGIAAVQIAAARGARVTGLVGSKDKQGIFQDLGRELGAESVLTNDEWNSADDRAAGAFDIILDATGGDSLKRSMRRLAPCGRIVSYGVSSLVTGPKRDIVKVLRGILKTPIYTPFKLMNENKGVFGLNMLQLFEPPAPGQDPYSTPMARAFDGAIAAFEQKRFRAIVGKIFSLEDGGAAHQHLQSRSNVGKVVLTLRDPN